MKHDMDEFPNPRPETNPNPMPKRDFCVTCGGTGEVTYVGWHMDICTDCDGYGYTVDGKKLEYGPPYYCSVCLGRGYIYIEEWGFPDSYDNYCPRCNGTGEESEMDKSNAKIRNMLGMLRNWGS